MQVENCIIFSFSLWHQWQAISDVTVAAPRQTMCVHNFTFWMYCKVQPEKKHCKLKRKFLRFKDFFVIFCWTHTYTPKLRHVTADYFPVLIGRLRDSFTIIAFFTQFYYNCTHRFLHFLVITSFCWLILIRGNNLGLKLLQKFTSAFGSTHTHAQMSSTWNTWLSFLLSSVWWYHRQIFGSTSE